MPQTVDPRRFMRRVHQIKVQIPILLSQWGLLPKFKRWRLTQDPDTGTVVLFGVLDKKYLATHTVTPFSDYFNPRMLHEFSEELHVQVLPSASDGLRYAFVLDKGQLALPPPADTYTIDEALPSGIQIEIRSAPSQPNPFVVADDHIVQHQRLDRYLRIVEALEATKNATTEPLPEVLLKNEAEFNQKMAEYEDERNKNTRLMP